MLEIELQRQLPCAPDVAWSLLADPGRINLWSWAQVRSLALGDGGHVAGVGALRRVEVRVPGRVEVDQVVEVADPGARFAYRAYGLAAVRHHLADLTFAQSGSGTQLSWRVQLALGPPAAEVVVRRAVAAELRRSLDRLVAAAPTATALPAPPLRAWSTDRDLDVIARQAAALEREQRALATELSAVDDPKRWFVRFCAVASECLRGAILRGRFTHPSWVLRVFDATYAFHRDSLLASVRRDRARLEAHWGRVFAQIARLPRAPGRQVEVAIAPSVAAMVEEDLPRALARVFAEDYAGRCDFVRFRADLLAFAEVMGEAGQRLRVSVRPGDWPLPQRWADAAGTRFGGPLFHAWLSRRVLGAHLAAPQRGWQQAFGRGHRIAHLLVPGAC